MSEKEQKYLFKKLTKIRKDLENTLKGDEIDLAKTINIVCELLDYVFKGGEK